MTVKMTVKNLIDQINFLVQNNYLKEDDFVLLVGTGDIPTDYIQTVCMPKLDTNINPFEEKKGYCHIGFCSNSKDNFTKGESK
jgi:hypothetical protein